jgi:hypothetical protein
MTYFVFVAAFGAGTVFFLWLRDTRIYYRTGLHGYRIAAHRGVLYGALALLGFFLTLLSDIELLGLGLILAALYLQGQVAREKVWTGGEPALVRLFGSIRQKKDKDTGKK